MAQGDRAVRSAQARSFAAVGLDAFLQDGACFRASQQRSKSSFEVTFWMREIC
jgi:hypothetical protein